MAGYFGGMTQQRRGDEGDVRTEEKSTGREIRDDPLEFQHIGGRDPPTSQVGYGGGHGTSELAEKPYRADAPSSTSEWKEKLGEGKAHGGRFFGGHGHSDPRLSEDQPMMKSSGKYGTTAGAGGGPLAHEFRSYGTTDTHSSPSESGLGSCASGGYAGEGGATVQSDEKHSGSRYSTCHGNSFPHEAGTGECPPGGYPEEGGGRRMPVTYKSQHYQDSSDQHDLPVPMRLPGAVLLDENHFSGPKYENEPTTTSTSQPIDSPSDKSLEEGEVRGGVPHGIVSGKASGAGQDNYGTGEVSRAPVSSPVGHQGLEPQEYQQTGAGSLPHPDRPAYSQQYTQPQGPSTHASQLEEAQEFPKPTTGETTNTSPTASKESDAHRKGGIMSKIKTHLPGHHKHPAGMDHDNKQATTTGISSAAEQGKPDLIEKMKDRLTLGHHSHDTSEKH